MSEKLKYISTVNMSHDEWLQRRRGSIGGSDASAVVGLNPYNSAYSLWAEKTGRIPGFSGNLATEVGTYMEEFVARKFAEVTGKKVRRCNNIIYNPKYEFAHVNIDRDVVAEDAGLECKTTSELNLRKFRNVDFPEIYYAQCVHSMAVTGKSRWYLAVLIGNKDFRWFTLERDEAEVEALMAAESEFWKLVQEDVPPLADGHRATTDALSAVHGIANDKTLDLAVHKGDLLNYIALGKRIAELETERAEAANRIKRFMGDFGFGVHDDIRVSWKTSTRRTFDSKRFLKDHPDMDVSEYYKESTTRTFRVTEMEGE